METSQHGIRDFMDGTGGKDGAIRLPQQFETLAIAPQCVFGLLPRGDVSLDAEAGGKPTFLIEDTDVVSIQPHRTSIEAALFTLAVAMSGVQHFPAELAPSNRIVPISCAI